MKTRGITLVSAAALLLASAGAPLAQSGGLSAGADVKAGAEVGSGATPHAGAATNGAATTGAPTTGAATTGAGIALDLASLHPVDAKLAKTAVVKGLSGDEALDANIVDGAGKKLASVSDLLADGSGQIKAVVASVGGILGIGARKVALPLDRLEVSQGSEGDFVTNATEAELKAMAEYHAKAPAVPAAPAGPVTPAPRTK